MQIENLFVLPETFTFCRKNAPTFDRCLFSNKIIGKNVTFFVETKLRSVIELNTGNTNLAKKSVDVMLSLKYLLNFK